MDNVCSAKACLVERESVRNSIYGMFSSLMCLLGLSSVVGMAIVSIYPEEVARECKY